MASIHVELGLPVYQVDPIDAHMGHIGKSVVPEANEKGDPTIFEKFTPPSVETWTEFVQLPAPSLKKI